MKFASVYIIQGQKMLAGKVYDLEYKIRAVKLTNEIGQAKAATELGIPKYRIYLD